MTVWLVLTAMVAVASVFAAAPFIRRQERKRLESEKTLAVRRDQPKETGFEAGQDAIDAGQAEAARPPLAAVGIDADAESPLMSGRERAVAAIGVAAVVVLGSVALFFATGNLDAGVQPAAANSAGPIAPSRSPLAQADVAVLASLAQSAPAAPTRTPLPSVDELIQRLVARLQSSPKDVQGWRTLGWSYFNLARYDEAAAAYAKAIELDPDSADSRDGRIESLLRGAGGSVTPAVRDAVEETLKRHPGDARARFVKGLALDQGGDRAAAEQAWSELKRDLDPNDPWAKEVDKKLGAKAAEKPETIATPASDPPPAAADGKGPTASDVRAADAMAPADRAAMIERMVAGLADRLDKSPRDADGWTKLIRSWMVLGKTDKAKDALDSALKAFADDPEQMRRLTATAEDLGLKR